MSVRLPSPYLPGALRWITVQVVAISPGMLQITVLTLVQLSSW